MLSAAVRSDSYDVGDDTEFISLSLLFVLPALIPSGERRPTIADLSALVRVLDPTAEPPGCTCTHVARAQLTR